MRWLARPRLALVLLAAGALSIVLGGLLIGAFGGGDAGTRAVTSTDGLASAPRLDGLVAVQEFADTGRDDRRVTGVVATPRAAPSRGCVIWQHGLDSSKEDSSRASQGFASLGLTTVSIDFEHHGARASGSAELAQLARSPNRIAQVVRRTVADLRSTIDYLENQPYCRQNVAVAGVSLGGVIGTILAATDDRVKAAVVMSTPGTFRAVLNTHGGRIAAGVARDRARLRAALRVLSPLDPVRFIGRISPRPTLILSGIDDEIVPISNGRLLQAAARKPKTIVNYRGGHDPAAGPAASSNGEAVASFLLRYVVAPTYGISTNANGTFTQP